MSAFNRKPYAIIPADPSTLQPDFRVSRIAEQHWEIVPLSKRGLHWSEANFSRRIHARGRIAIHTDLAGANAFLSSARALGYRSEHVGPTMTTIL